MDHHANYHQFICTQCFNNQYQQIDINRYSFSIVTFQSRVRSENGISESKWARQFNERLHRDFNFTVDLPAVFIDTFYNRDNPVEVDKFHENTEKLWSFAQSKLGNKCPRLNIEREHFEYLCMIESSFIISLSLSGRTFPLIMHFCDCRFTVPVPGYSSC